MSSSSPFGSATPAKTTSSSLFGIATPSQPTSSFSLGSATTAQPTSGFSFGSSTLDQPPFSSSFGSSTLDQFASGFSSGSSTLDQSPLSFSFGSSTLDQFASGFSSGSSTLDQSPLSFSFGSATPAKTTSSSLFGIATPSQPTSSFSLGSATTAQPTSGFSFGSSTLDQPPFSSSFGSSTLDQFASGFSSGSSTLDQSPLSFSFGSATPAKPKSSSLFGSPTLDQSTINFLFGSATPAQFTSSSSFGSSTAAKATRRCSVRTATPAKPKSSSLFGSSTAAQPTTSSPATALEAPSKCPAPTSTMCKVKAQTFKFPAVNQNSELKDTDSKEVNPPLQFKIPVFSGGKPPSWRNVQWTEERRSSLMEAVGSYTPGSEEVTQARVLLLGPVGSGKSSFISSVHSVFNGRVTNRAMVGASSTSFTKKLQSFNICGQKNKVSTKLVLCDSMGLGEGEMTGLTLHDILSVIKGHVPEGHKFCPDQAVRSETGNYVKWPSLKDKIHCVAFVLDASKITTYPNGLRASFQQLREHISDMGIHQVALLTHVDEICTTTATDVSMVYASEAIKETMSKAADLMGMSTSYIVPVKNYSSELDLDVNTDVLLLSAVEHILQYVDLFFLDNTPQETDQEKEIFDGV